MTDVDDDQWPLPGYPTVGAKEAHALGVITLNFNQLEFAYFRLFAHHLERLEVGVPVAWNHYSLLPEHNRARAITGLFGVHEPDRAVVDHVEHALRFWNRCAQNRNYLFHARAPNPTVAQMLLTKPVREKWAAIHRMELPLARLRQVADEMFVGFEYVWDLWGYLQRRDLASRPGFPGGLFPAALPQKPALPDSLAPLQNPRVPEEPSPQPSPSPE